MYVDAQVPIYAITENIINRGTFSDPRNRDYMNYKQNKENISSDEIFHTDLFYPINGQRPLSRSRTRLAVFP